MKAAVGSAPDLEAGMTFGLGGGGSLEIVISGVPDGASLSAGTDKGDGTWTMIPAELPLDLIHI